MSRRRRRAEAAEPVLPAPLHRTLLLVTLSLGSSLGLTHWIAGRSNAELSIGYLRTEHSVIVAPETATIREIHQQPGTIVELGDIVAVLGDPGLDARLDNALRETASLEAAVAQARAAAEVELTLRMREFDGDEFKARSLAADHMEKQYYNEFQQAAMEDILERQDGVSSTDPADAIFQLGVLQNFFASDETRLRAVMRQEAARNAAEVNAAQVKLCEQRIERIASLRSQLPEKIGRAKGVDVAELKLAEARATVEQLEQLRERLTLRASAWGTVGLFRRQVGDRVEPGESVVFVFDRDRPYLELPVPSRLVARFPAGTQLRLRFSGDTRCQGRVSAVPPHTTEELHNTDGRDATVLIRVEPVGRLWPDVPVGSAVEVVAE